MDIPLSALWRRTRRRALPFSAATAGVLVYSVVWSYLIDDVNVAQAATHVTVLIWVLVILGPIVYLAALGRPFMLLWRRRQQGRETSWSYLVLAVYALCLPFAAVLAIEGAYALIPPHRSFVLTLNFPLMVLFLLSVACSSVSLIGFIQQLALRLFQREHTR